MGTIYYTLGIQYIVCLIFSLSLSLSLSVGVCKYNYMHLLGKPEHACKFFLDAHISISLTVADRM